LHYLSFLAVSVEHQLVTDRRTERQTDRQTTANTRVASVVRVKPIQLRR